MRIVVVGAGAIGANIAYRLAVRGGEVILVDGRPPSSGTSGASFSWLSSFPQLSWAEDPRRRALRLSVNAHFDRLAEELGGDWLDWCGTLTVESAVPDFDDAISRSVAAGAQLDVLEREDIAAIAPQLRLPEGERVAFELRSGWVDAPAMIEQLIRVLRLSGGVLQIGQEVTGICRDGARVTGITLADGSKIASDMVVNAGGASATHIAAMANLSIPMELVPGLMLYGGRGREDLPRHIINGARWLIRPDRKEGTAIHWRGEGLTAVHGNNGADSPAMMRDVAQALPGLAGLSPSRECIGIRAIPFGGPVIGRLPWLEGYYSAVSHGGIGWGPIWAELAAQEILDGEGVAELASLRPSRFYMDVSS